MKLYTKRGDDGGTDLFGGQRVSKDSLRVAAYGTVDELNAAVGLAAAACRGEEISAALRTIQSRLFELGADLASPRPADAGAPDPLQDKRIGDAHITEVERFIDATTATLAPMRHFVLPGGSELSARLHLARTICRRAERDCVTLAREEGIAPPVLFIVYLNRLSDLLFALARRANQLEGVADVAWK